MLEVSDYPALHKAYPFIAKFIDERREYKKKVPRTGAHMRYSEISAELT